METTYGIDNLQQAQNDIFGATSIENLKDWQHSMRTDDHCLCFRAVRKKFQLGRVNDHPAFLDIALTNCSEMSESVSSACVVLRELTRFSICVHSRAYLSRAILASRSRQHQRDSGWRTGATDPSRRTLPQIEQKGRHRRRHRPATSRKL